jgi:beta-mannosidase
VVLRLRGHPSLALWAGDNENDLSAGWGLGECNRPDPNRNRITREVLPRVVLEYDPMRPYLPSSPFVSAEAFAGEAEPAEAHLWGGPRAYWKHPYYTKNSCRFCSEGGAHGLPARESLERMMPTEDVRTPWTNPEAADCRALAWTPQWVYHATNPYLDMENRVLVHRNDHLLNQAGALFGDVARDDIDALVAQTQSSQAESIKFQVELFRSRKFAEKDGFVVWNLRDGWPTISDAICDWYGTRKKAYFALQAAFRDVLPIVTEDHRLVVVNDRLVPAAGHVTLTEARNGQVVFDSDFTAPANGVLNLASVAWDGQGLFLIDCTAGGTSFHTHYLHGDPPFRWEDYVEWTKDLFP